ncbi:MAG: GNAT family N-acetyltransferase [Oscillospiraceae bacterium]|nr:GNAT family N-acetyltransferase [Oscillospiraceae bacterium]
MFEEISIVKLSKAQCVHHKQALVALYFDNVKSCSFTASFSYGDAESKIDKLIEYVGNGTALVFGCIDGIGTLVGFIWAYSAVFREEERMYISVVQIDDAYRGHGLGTQLLKAAEAEARSAGLPALYIHTEAHNQGAIRLYEREGYVLERVQLRKQV